MKAYQKSLIWRFCTKLYRKYRLIRSLFFRPFFKQVGTNFGIETGNFRISGLSNISIGDNFVLSHGCILMGEGGIEIGNNVLIGPYTQLYSFNHGYKDRVPIVKQTMVTGKIVVEDDVWIGANTIILRGVTIGKGSVVGAGSVVTKDIPSFSIYAGNPARLVKMR